MLKVVFALLALALLVIAAGISGALFYLWPTFLGDHQLGVTEATLTELAAFQAEPKFLADSGEFYPGAPSEAVRFAAESHVNITIASLVRELPKSPQRATVLRILKSSLAAFQNMDTEEMERLVVYFERINRIVGVSSSGQLFNVWRYGFPYGWFTAA